MERIRQTVASTSKKRLSLRLLTGCVLLLPACREEVPQAIVKYTPATNTVTVETPDFSLVEIDIVDEWGLRLARQRITAPHLATVVLADSLPEQAAKGAHRVRQELAVFVLHQKGTDKQQYKYKCAYPAVGRSAVTLEGMKNPFP